MRTFYNALVKKENNGRMSDKSFLIRMAASITLIITMLMALTFSAYGYFSDTLSSSKSVVSSSSYSLKITPPVDAALIMSSGGESYLLNNSTSSVDKEYIFNLVTSDTCTATVGYCKIEVITDKNNTSNPEDKQVFYTDSIWNSSLSADTTKTVSRDIKIIVPAGKIARVNLIAEWGTCISPITDNIVRPEYL